METTKIYLPKGKEAYGITAIPYKEYINVTYELKDSWEPKDGDFISYTTYNMRYLLIYKQTAEGKIEGYIILNTSLETLYTDGALLYFKSAAAPATEEEKQQLLDIMHKRGSDWDAENKKIVPYWWKPNNRDFYYYVNSYIEVNKHMWGDDCLDNVMYNNHNCFQTEKEAKVMRDKLLKVLNGAKLRGE